MPGELGNHEESQEVGHYEHRYDQQGSDPIPQPEGIKKPKAQMVINVIRKMNESDSGSEQ